MTISQTCLARVTVLGTSTLMALPLAFSMGMAPVRANEVTVSEESTALETSEECPVEKPTLLMLEGGEATLVEEDGVTVLPMDQLFVSTPDQTEELQVALLLPAGTVMTDESLEEIYGAGWFGRLMRSAPRAIRGNALTSGIQGGLVNTVKSTFSGESLTNVGFSAVGGVAEGSCSGVTFGFFDKPCEALGRFVESGTRIGVDRVRERWNRYQNNRSSGRRR